MLVDRIWQSQPGRYFFLCSKSARGKWEEHCFKRSEIKRVAAFVEEHRDRDLYFCPHGFSKPQRIKPNAEMPSLLWADMDLADPRETKLKPTVAIESSPGRFVGLWMLDSAMEESLNRRLTYALGADEGGWDLTQVLRIPGTTNYKYSSLPRVRILWSDGPEYSVRAISRALPAEKEVEQSSEELDSWDVYQKYERKLPHWCRKELINGKPAAGKRSEMIWKLEHTLIEAGVTREEAFVLIKSSPWNKFRGRRNEDEQLKRELDKALSLHMKAARPVAGESEGDDYVWLSKALSEVEEEDIDWLWYPYLARGEVTIVEGDAGLGKSLLVEMISGGIIDGAKLPTVRKGDKPVQGRVCHFDMENTAGSVTKKRLLGNGFKHLEHFFQEERPFSIDDDETLDRVFDALERVKPVLCVFDTLNTYLGKADAFKGHEAQQAFIRFKEIAQRFNCAVAVVRHLTKDSKQRALYRGQGSIAFAGVARVVVTVGVLPTDTDVRVMAISKLNIARRPPGLTFEISALSDTMKERDRSKFSWGKFVEISADDILGIPEKDEQTEDARKWLARTLSDGEVEEKRLMRMATARGFNEKLLHKLGQECVKRSHRGRTFWSS